MIIEGEYHLPCKIGDAWQALNDPQTLQRCIAGCDSIEKTGDNSFECLVTAKYGPVKTRFRTLLNVSNINAPHSYTLNAEGKGGLAGFGKGSADVRLSQEGETTRLFYQAEFTRGRETGPGRLQDGRGDHQEAGKRFLCPLLGGSCS